MALTTAELARLKYELGFNLISTAQPYIDVVSIFEGVIQPYLQAGVSTTSATTVTAASAVTPVTLTLTSGTGFVSGDRVVIDVDDRQEVVTAQLVSGVSLTALLKLAHTGTYPVVQEGGESIIREILTRIREVKVRLATSFGSGSLKKVDEVEWYQAGGNTTQFGLLGTQLSWWRDELASALGIPSMWAQKRAGAQRLANY